MATVGSICSGSDGNIWFTGRGKIGRLAIANPPIPNTVVTIPAAASIHGSAGTFFHTDLWVLNRSYSQVVEITATFNCFTRDDCRSVTKRISIRPRESSLLTDVVAGFFGAPEAAGAIQLKYDANIGSIVAGSRTFSPSSPLPSVGTWVPALRDSEARTRAVLIGLASSGGDGSVGFRTNAGLFNPGPNSASVSLALFAGDGTARWSS